MLGDNGHEMRHFLKTFRLFDVIFGNISKIILLSPFRSHHKSLKMMELCDRKKDAEKNKLDDVFF